VRSAVDVDAEVSVEVEGVECLVALPRTFPEDLVEHAFPGHGVEMCRRGEDAVHVEQHRVVSIGSNGAHPATIIARGWAGARVEAAERLIDFFVQFGYDEGVEEEPKGRN
jgi:hypothetical protein